MKKTLIAITLILLVVVGGYGAGIGYYADRFHPNTSFGSVDISNLTFQEAHDKIEQELNNRQITLMENGQEIGQFNLAEVKPNYQMDDALAVAYKKQNPNNWLLQMFSSDRHDVSLTENITVDSVVLAQVLAEEGINNVDRTPSKDASIEYQEATGYQVEPEKQGNQIDLEKLQSNMIEQIQAGGNQVNVNESYSLPLITTEDERITDTMKAIEEAINTQITLQISGNEEVIPQKEIEKWVYFDDNNQIVYDAGKIHEYLGTLNEKYATYDKTRQFNSTLQGTVDVQPGTLGWSIDRETETSNIITDLQASQDVKRDPAIVGTGYNSQGDDIGNTYVEVDIANQTMFIYKDGEQVFQTPVVTGQVGTDTVPGAYSIWDKEENAILRGYNPRTDVNYEQPVAYWMPFDYDGQGIHDANWQSSFGGVTYTQSGSLGCINTPPDAMVTVFQLVDVGTPVIVF